MKKLFSQRLLLAPMEEVNDPAFRMLCKKAGCGKTFTGMIHPLSREKLILEDKPVLQIFTTHTSGIRSFIKKYDSKVSGWDFNLGCPAKNARKHGFGSFLRDLKIIEEILKEMRLSTKKPVIVKIRKSDLALKFLKLAEKYCDAITIHPRTQAQGYSGNADIKFALKIKKLSKIPVIYSGDVNSKNYSSLLKQFDYLMIGRSAIGNPNIFSLNKKKPTNYSFKDYLVLAKKYNLKFRQIKFQAMNFTKSKPHAKEIRLKLIKCKTLKDIEDLNKKESF